MLSLPTSVVQTGRTHYVTWKQFCVAKVWDLKDHHNSCHKKEIRLKHKNFRYPSQILLQGWFLALTYHSPLLVEMETFITFARISYVNKQMRCIHFYINIQTLRFSGECAMFFTNHYQRHLIKLTFGFFFWRLCIFNTLGSMMALPSISRSYIMRDLSPQLPFQKNLCYLFRYGCRENSYSITVKWNVLLQNKK